MRKTAWAKGSSSLPSDRIRPSNNSGGSKSKGKNQKNAGPPKSPQVLKLEQQISDLTSSSLVDPDPKGGCFCQARAHDLSAFTPICTSCGLVLCTLNRPHYSCPHCCYPLISNTTRDTLIAQLLDDVRDTIVKEDEARERAREDARNAAGAFPTLTGSATPNANANSSSRSSSTTRGAPTVPAGPATSTHKVMSLTQKGKKVVISSYTTKPVSDLQSASVPAEVVVAEPERWPPPGGPGVATVQRDEQRPFMDLVGGGRLYVPVKEEAAATPPERRRRKNKGKEKEEGKDNVEENVGGGDVEASGP